MAATLTPVSVRPNSARTGILLTMASAVLWSGFPVITKLSFQSVPLEVAAALSNFFGLLFFAAVMTVTKSWSELKIKCVWPAVAGSVVLNGLIYYTFIYLGSSLTSAGNVGVIMQLEVLSTILILRYWGHDRLNRSELGGALMMLLGALVVLFPGKIEFNLGDLFILIAIFFPPFGNTFTQRARQHISSSTFLFFRCAASTIFFGGWVFLAGSMPNTSQVREVWPLLLINGVLMLGVCKILWVEAIHRISVTKAIAITSIQPALTLFFAYLVLHEQPVLWQLLGVVPLMVGVQMLLLRSAQAQKSS